MVSLRLSRQTRLAARLCAASLVIAAALTPAAAQAQTTTPLTLSVTGIIEIDHPDGGFGSSCYGDYVVVASIDGDQERSREFSLDPPGGCIIDPRARTPIDFTFTKTVDVPDTPGATVPIKIFVEEIDFAFDQRMDISPLPNTNELNLKVTDPFSGTYVLDAPGAQEQNVQFFEGDGANGPRAGIEFSITGAPDSDGDGIPDARETAGVDWDGSGTVGDVPGERTDPERADLFLELDVADSPSSSRVLQRNAIQAIKEAFRKAPRSNPDGSTGIDLWIDTGDLVDATATEGTEPGTCLDGIDNGGDGLADTGVDSNNDGTLDIPPDPNCQAPSFADSAVEDRPFPATCADGIDNDGNGRSDSADPTCLVGDNLGGGGKLAGTLTSCGLDTANFYLTKNADTDGDGVPEDLDGAGGADNAFDISRRPWFRYAISVPPSDTDTSTDSDGDGNAANDPCIGGQGEIGGNDFVDHNGDAGTIMHELGHNLDLDHGGDDGDNCKPNYVSVMNYDHQFGVRRMDGGSMLDFSRPRIEYDGSPRGRVLPNLDEFFGLDERTILDPDDDANLTMYLPLGAANRIALPLNENPNYDGDGAMNDPPFETSLRANINDGAPCQGSATDQNLKGFDDWPAISLPFRQFGDAANAAIDPEDPDLPTLDELLELERTVNTVDLSVSGSDSPDPVQAGGTIDYEVTVRNRGPSPATQPVLEVDFAEGLELAGSPDVCVPSSEGATCRMAALTAGSQAVLNIRARTTSAIPFVEGGPTRVTSRFSLANGSWPDSASSDNRADVSTRVNRPPNCSTVRPNLATLGPSNHKLTPVAVGGATDPDGDRLGLTITAVSQDEPLNGLGDGDSSPDAARAPAQDRVLLRAERSGRGDGRVYRIAFTVSDGTGGACSGTARVGVPRAPRSIALDSAPPSFNSFGP